MMTFQCHTHYSWSYDYNHIKQRIIKLSVYSIGSSVDANFEPGE